MKKLNFSYSNGLSLLMTSVVLAGMLFLTLATINTSKLNQSIVANIQNVQQSEFAAEATIKEAQNTIYTQAFDKTKFKSDCAGGFCTQFNGKRIWNNTPSWTTAKTVGSDLSTRAKLQENPKYLVEYVGDKRKVESLSSGQTYQEDEDYTSSPVYRVTGQAKGKTGEKTTVIQTTIY